MRKPNIDLTNFICRHVKREFEWGKFDCCLFAAEAVKLQTGEDLAAEFRGRYKTAIGAKRALKRHGYNNVADVIQAKLGEPIPRLHAQIGDVATIDTEQGIAAGVVFGASIYAPGPDGMTATPIKNAINIYGVK